MLFAPSTLVSAALLAAGHVSASVAPRAITAPTYMQAYDPSGRSRGYLWASPTGTIVNTTRPGSRFYLNTSTTPRHNTFVQVAPASPVATIAFVYSVDEGCATQGALVFPVAAGAGADEARCTQNMPFSFAGNPAVEMTFNGTGSGQWATCGFDDHVEWSRDGFTAQHCFLVTLVAVGLSV